MALELAVAGEAESADDSNNCRGVRLQALGHGADAEQHVLARVLEDRPDDFLPLDTELVNALCEMGCGCLGVYLLAIHVARGLPNLGRVSTWSAGDRDAQRAEQNQVLLFRRGRFGFQAGGNYRLKERHHRTKFRAELFDGQRLLAMASGEEVGAALFVFFDPGLGETTVADFRENLAHFLARLFGDDARSSGVVALLGSVADGIAHVTETATVDQINDELEFVEAFEIGDLGLVARFRERFESRFDQFADAAAEHGLLAEKIRLGLLGEGGFQDAGTRAAESSRVSKRESFCRAGGVLFDSEERWSSAAFGEDFANAVAGSLGSDHGDVDVGGRLDGAEANVEAVREHEGLAGLEIWRNGVAIEFGLLGVRCKNHDHIGPSRGFGGRIDGEAFFFGFGAGGAALGKSHADRYATVTQIERMCVALRAVADDGDFLCLNE